ncbi:hypothetical protein [Thermococcus piezophilus]|uniref:Uncharacterized protein n=1 Tax=Thermococcus piezophilus TaxID=1712654 RepID=A0A172WEQ1_9EURY|nr:hypothetical protein [Thermococcus piezophilus]ANF21881.1 hypothetical protein A7C91_00675 [Thermococcus piezophilus]
MEDKDKRLIEYTIEAMLMAWLGYLFFYQNYLLYTWHRGLPLPSKWPFVLLGIGLGALFFWYELRELERELLEKEKRESGFAGVPVVAENEPLSKEGLEKASVNEES